MASELKNRAILVEVLRNRFQAVVEEMGALILRAGHTVFVKETADFGAAVVSNRGEVAAAPVSTGVALMVGMPCDTAAGLSQTLGLIGSLLVAAPALVFAWLGITQDPSLHLVALISGVGAGLLAVIIGVWAGGRVFDRRGPEIMAFALSH